MTSTPSHEATLSVHENMSPISEGDDGDDDCMKLGDVDEKALQFPSVNDQFAGYAHRYGVQSSTSGSSSAEVPTSDVQEEHRAPCASILIELAGDGEPATEPTPSRPQRSVYKHVFGSGLSPVLQKQCDKYKIRKRSIVGANIDRPDVPGVRTQPSRLGRSAAGKPAVPPLPLHALTGRHPAGMDQSPRLRASPHPHHQIPSGSPIRPAPSLAAAKAQPTTPRRQCPSASMISPDTGMSPRSSRPAMSTSATLPPRTPRSLGGQGQSTPQRMAGKGPMTPRSGGSEAASMTPRTGAPVSAASPRSANGKPFYVSPRPPSIKLTPRGIDAVRYLVGASSNANNTLAPRYQPVADVDMANKLDQMLKESNLAPPTSASQLSGRKGLPRRAALAAASAPEERALNTHPGMPHSMVSSGKGAGHSDGGPPKCHCGCAIM